MADFADDLYRGTAEAYHRYRRPYPQRLIDALLDRTGVDHASTVVDLACGTGQVARALAPHVGTVIAIDQEPELVEMGRRTAPDIDWRVGRAEEVTLVDRADLVAIGNAFHRLDGDAVARRVWELLDPSGALALLWTHTPWEGDRPWQRAMADVVRRWRTRLASDSPTADAVALPQVLYRNGFASHERIEVTHDETWTADELVGFTRSTSILNDRVLGRRSAEFEVELRSALATASTGERFSRTAEAALDLARPADTTAQAAIVLHAIAALRQTRTPVIVAIDGRSGGGKSTLAAEIARSLPSCSVIDGDDFYAGGSEAEWDAMEPAHRAERGIDWRRQRPVLEALRRGEPGHWRLSGLSEERGQADGSTRDDSHHSRRGTSRESRTEHRRESIRAVSWHGFDWDRFDGTLRAEPTICEPAEVVILEGAYSARPELADLIDLRVLVETPDDVRRARCISRDGDEWHEEWFRRWSEAEDHYFGIVAPARGFDLVLEG